MRFRLDETRKFGVEIELALPHRATTLASRLNAVGIAAQTESYNHRLRPHWKITTDASVSGGGSGYSPMEVVSPPMKGLDGLRQLETVCAVLNEMGAKVNRSCGLHVHHDARDFDLEAWQSVAKCYVKYEHVIDQLMAPSRRGNTNTYCRSLFSNYTGQTPAAVWERIDDCHSIYQMQSLFGTRFVKLNLEAASVHGTVEFRQHHGTTNFAKIAAWICLTQGMVVRSIEHKPITLRSTDKPFDSLMWTSGAAADLRRYYWGRYNRNGRVDGDVSDAVEILDGRVPRQTRGPQARNRPVTFDEAPVPAEDALLTPEVSLVQDDTGQVFIDVPAVTMEPALGDYVEDVTTFTINWDDAREPLSLTAEQMNRLYQSIERTMRNHVLGVS